MIKKVQLIDKEIERLKKLRDIAIKNSMVKCFHCRRSTSTGKLIYHQHMDYVRPYGCTGGDYYVDGEGRFDCPKCGKENRIYNRPEIVDRKFHFKNIEKIYPKE